MSRSQGFWLVGQCAQQRYVLEGTRASSRYDLKMGRAPQGRMGWRRFVVTGVSNWQTGRS